MLRVRFLSGDPALSRVGQPGAQDGEQGQRHAPARSRPARSIQAITSAPTAAAAADGQQPLRRRSGPVARRGRRGLPPRSRSRGHIQRRPAPATIDLRIVQPVVHGQFPIQQVEIEPDDPRQRFQLMADQPLLGGAVHLVDAVAHPGGVRRAAGSASPTRAVADLHASGTARGGGRLAIVAAIAYRIRGLCTVVPILKGMI